MASTPKNGSKSAVTRVLGIAEQYPAVVPIIEREFKRICPTLELLDFWHYGERNRIAFAGREADLLTSGVIDSSMIAVRPKRRHYAAGAVWTRRRAGDRVEVDMRLGQKLDRDHPLAPLAIWNWEKLLKQSQPPPGPHSAPEWMDKMLEKFAGDLNFLKSWNGKLWRGQFAECINPRFRFAPEDISRMESIIHRFGTEILAAMTQARVMDSKRDRLRLVVDNGPAASYE